MKIANRTIAPAVFLRLRPFLFTLTVAASFLLCSVHEPGDASDRSSSVRVPLKIDARFDETSLFLAGKEIPTTSTLHTYSQGMEYQAYRRRMDASWNRLQTANLQKIEAWREKHLPKKYTDTVFYPFSGPDVLNALAFFPNGTEYVLFGLESPGRVPDPHAQPPARLNAGLSGLSVALDNVLNVNYFKTVRMEKEVSTDSFNSIISVILFFLSRSDYEVIEVKNVWIADNGTLTDIAPLKKTGKTVAGSEILFRKNSSSPLKRVRYFQLNVIDNSLKIYTNFIPYLETYGRYATILKSASYLMHNEDKFTKIRSLVLGHSDYVLQDDSGAALRYFPTDTWKLTFHGTYSKPVPLFANRYQTELDNMIKTHSTGPLPFSYGYNFKENESNLMFAERIKKE
ncbi:MAG TPA: hypothetical protein VLM75_06395 [Spirochaetota bacterium]|nr:hypothetical protein [Spirochaetota bacterium]